MTKKGFTLIELLGVITVITIILLISTPIILNIMNDAKKAAAKDSFYMYVRAVETSVNGNPKIAGIVNGTFTTKDGNLYIDSVLALTVGSKGTKPKDGGTVTMIKGDLEEARLAFNGYMLVYKNKKVTIEGGAPAVTPTPTSNPLIAYTVGTEIYYNPETNKKCTAGEVNNTANAKTGCLKWNVITMGDTTSKTTVDIMLDHNTTGYVAWNSTGINTAKKEVATALQTDVTTWNSVVKSSARLISGQEVANIGNDTTWNDGNNTGTEYTSQPWLYQNLSGSNTITQPLGYWTDTADSSTSNNAWGVIYVGYLYADSVTYAIDCGVRPVITISKSVIE